MGGGGENVKCCIFVWALVWHCLNVAMCDSESLVGIVTACLFVRNGC